MIHLKIKENKRIKNLNKLNFSQIFASLEISHNDSLTNISSLNGANVVDSLTIYNNKSLNNCCAISHNLFDEDNKPSYILIDSNENNCDEIDSVKSFCLENEFPLEYMLQILLC